MNVFARKNFCKSLRLLIIVSLLFPYIVLARATITIPSSGIATITAAMVKAKAGDTVIVENGVYRKHIFIKAGVALKARNLHRAVLDGRGRGTVVTMGSNSSINGFVVRNGTIGVFTKNTGITVCRCLIKNNQQTGIITVRHLPKIEDNIIAYNLASGIQGWDVRSTKSSVNHNTIAYNGNHGIAVGGTSNIIVENNVVAFNERFALKLSSGSEDSKIVKNNFYKNLKQVQKIPSGNYSFDPAFISPRTALNFQSDPRSCCQIKASDNKNLGTRVNY